MIVLLLSSRGARLVDLPDPPPLDWVTVEPRTVSYPWSPGNSSLRLPAPMTRRHFTKVDTYTYVEREGVRA